MTYSNASLRVLAMLGAGALLTPSAMAQDTAEQPVAEDTTVDDDGNEVIVVTAQGRQQELSDTPIAISAVTAETLQNSGASDIRQLTQLTPSLSLTSSGTEANGAARMRGIGTVGDNPGLESSVAVFVDGVYRSRSGIGLNELGEVERVEVLRGPQGTLFGRNASAGLVHIISKKPSFDFEGFAEATYGNYDFLRLAGAVSGPFSETIAGRIEGVYARRDGFAEVWNATGPTGERTNDRDRYFVKAQVLFEPTEDISFRVIGDYTKRDESCCSGHYYSVAETFDPTPGVPGDFAVRPPSATSASGNRVVDILNSFGSPVNTDQYARRAYITPGRTLGGFTKDYGISGELNWSFGDVTLTSITAYRDYKSSQAGDVDYAVVDLLYRNDDGSSFRQFRTFTQELRLQGSLFDDKLDWLIGGYYADEKLKVRDNLIFGADYGQFLACRIVASISPSPALRDSDRDGDGCLSPTGNATVLGAFAQPNAAGGTDGSQLVAALQRLGSIGNVNQTFSAFDQSSRNYALFTHNILNITDRLSLTLGARYTNERKTVTSSFDIVNPACGIQQAAAGAAAASAVGRQNNTALPAAVRSNAGTAAALLGGATQFACLFNTSSQLNGLTPNDRQSEDEFTGTAVLSWKPVDELLLYGSYSKGYKAGGFNLDRSALGSPLTPRSNADVANLRFGAEKVDAYEIGAKYDGPGFDINLAAFRQEFKNFQLNTFNGLFFLVQNINGCSNLVGGDGADEDLIATTGTCAPGDVEAGVISQGVELEGTLRPARNFAVGAGFTYLDSYYKPNLVGTADGAVPLAPELFQLPGNRTSFAPEFSVTASATWTPELGNSGLSALFYVDTRMVSDANTGSDRFPEKEQDGYEVVNARVGIRGAEQRWALEVWAQNLLNAKYQQVAFNTPLQAAGAGSRAAVQEVGATGTPATPYAAQLFSAFLGEPRTYGITGRFRF